jgi:parallel beta-helix repeat protein
MFLGLRVNTCIIRDNRVRNTYKDSIHFAQSSSNNLIEKNTIRNSGDDNVALVSYNNASMANNTVQYNLGECGWWGRGFTNIGGDGNILRFNVAVDCTKSGVTTMVEDFGGNVTAEALNWVVERNVVVRCGNQNNHPQAAAIGISVGSGLNQPITGRMEDNLVVQPLFTTARLQGKIGDAPSGQAVFFRNNGLPAPTLADPAKTHQVRKYVSLATDSNLTDTPNYDLP